MKPTILLICLAICVNVFSQNDTTKIKDTAIVDINDSDIKGPNDAQPLKVFYDQRLINTNSVEVLHKGVMQFRVIHNFGDIAGKFGGIKRFFGLDAATDIKISFQVGLGERLNILAGRAKGDEAFTGDATFSIGQLRYLWELGLKYQFMKQAENDPKRPFSITAYINTVVSSMDTAGKTRFKDRAFSSFSDRMSELVQVMIARRFGNFSLQLTPTLVHTATVFPGESENLFALGGGIRIPITKKFFLIADYTHPFRTQQTIDILRSHNIRLYDIFGVGLEVVTEGHVFHMNFTNTTHAIENRMIPRTFTSWGEGKYRWGFNISRNFVLFRDKKGNK